MDYLATHTSLSQIRRGFAPGFVAASDKVYQLLAHGRWFSPDTPASSITKTGHHDLAGRLLKVALSTKIKSNQIIHICKCKMASCSSYRNAVLRNTIEICHYMIIFTSFYQVNDFLPLHIIVPLLHLSPSPHIAMV